MVIQPAHTLLKLIDWQKIKEWIIRKDEDESRSKAPGLVWLRKKAADGQKIDWSYVDTVDYDIDSILTKREAVLEFEMKPREVGEEWKKNLLQ